MQGTQVEHGQRSYSSEKKNDQIIIITKFGMFFQQRQTNVQNRQINVPKLVRLVRLYRYVEREGKLTSHEYIYIYIYRYINHYH